MSTIRTHKGFINPNEKNSLSDSGLNNFDLATTKFYKGVKPMWEQLGFKNDDSDIPNQDIYWKNIIPKDFNYNNLSGITENKVLVDDEVGVSKGAKITRQSYNEIIIDEENQQVWDDNYYYPTLPKLNKYGIFIDDVNVENSYGVDTAPITNLNEVDENLILDLDLSDSDTDDLIDKTDFNKINYNQDFQLSLDDNLRLETNTLIIPDGIQKNNSEQAF